MKREAINGPVWILKEIGVGAMVGLAIIGLSAMFNPITAASQQSLAKPLSLSSNTHSPAVHTTTEALNNSGYQWKCSTDDECYRECVALGATDCE